MSNVLIVESPAKCQKIRSFLGPDWNVIATMGHIRALEPSLEAVGLQTGFQPKYQWIKEKAKAIQQLKQVAKEATTIWLASDDDREGEMISHSVCVLLKLDPTTTHRVVFHEITEKAIRHAIAHPRSLDMNRVEAQQARAMLDMMIGFTMSPLLWKHVAPTLSAGRCQTPALRLVIERENTVNSFISTQSWQMESVWLHKPSRITVHSRMEDEVEDEESVQNVMEHARDHPEGTLLSNKTTAWSESPPDPLMTSTLQQQASQLYHCSPKQTMSIAQRLYEAGHITYMRTDKAVMSEEAKEQARRYVQETYGEEYVMPLEPLVPFKKTRRPKASESEKEQAGNAQEAHEAIRPTHLDHTTLSSDQWGPCERKIYELISRRALQSVMAPVRGQTIHLRILLDELEDFPWRAEYKRTEFDGWKRLGAVALLDGEQEEDQKGQQDQKDQWEKWQFLKAGDRLEWGTMEGKEKESRSQGRYTEASLVRELEHHGIGRPSTFASLLSVIQEKRYVEVTDLPVTEKAVKEYHLTKGVWPYRVESKKKKVGGEKRKLIPTALGRSVWEWMVQHFEDLFAYGFTAAMEKQLDHVADGSIQRTNVIQTVWDTYRDRYALLLSSASSASSASSEQDHNYQEQPEDDQKQDNQKQDSQKQRTFLGGLKAVQTKKGPLLLREGPTKEQIIFLGWPTGVSWNGMTEEKARQFEAQKQEQNPPESIMEWRDKPVYKKTGPYGTYLQWDTVRIPYLHGEDPDETAARLEKKVSGPAAVLKEGKEYVIRSGPYGPYMMKQEKQEKQSKKKTDAKKTETKQQKKPIYVSLPKGIDIEKITEKEMEGLYQMGLEQKKAQKVQKNKTKP